MRAVHRNNIMSCSCGIGDSSHSGGEAHNRKRRRLANGEMVVMITAAVFIDLCGMTAAFMKFSWSTTVQIQQGFNTAVLSCRHIVLNCWYRY